MSTSVLSPIREAIDAIAAGRMVIVVDDEDRENEGDLVVAAEHATSETINFMATHGRGLICLAMAGALLDRLQIPMMVPQQQNRSGFGTGFTVSVEAAAGVSTGISTPDRAHTIRTLIDPATTVNDIASPGHVFPLRARDGGVLERRGQTEASVDLARLAGLVPAGVICEVMREDGEMMRLPELLRFAGVHGLPVVSVEQLAVYRRARGRDDDAPREGAGIREASAGAFDTAAPNGERPGGESASIGTKVVAPDAGDDTTSAPLVTLIGRSRLPTAHGEFDVTVFRDAQGLEHSALTRGTPGDGAEPPLVRLHSECLTGDAFGSLRCDCGPQLHGAMRRIHEAGRGAILYLRQEGRGIGLGNKIRAYTLQDEGLDTVEANRALGFPDDARRYEVAAAMLDALDIRSLRLLSNNPAKRRALVELGIEVAEGLPIVVEPHSHNVDYLRTKVERMGHDAELVHGPNGVDEDALAP